MSVLPPSEALKMQRLKHVTTAQEIADAEQALASWESTFMNKDKSIQGVPADSQDDVSGREIFDAVPVKTLPKQRKLPAVRGSVADTLSADHKTFTTGE
jgi:hypothetical protein